MPPTRLDLAGLTTRIVGPSDATTTCVLFHGFGAPGDDLVSLAGALEVPVRFVFPAAPRELGGMYGDARAWWMIDIARFQAERDRGAAASRHTEAPAGLAEARARVMQLLAELQTRFAITADQIVLGGFSQGAMLAVDVALHRDTPPAGLILMSGTLIAASEWQPRMASLAGVPVMQSHGRQDAILPFGVAEVLRDKLIAAGAIVDWRPFSGGHEIPGQVIDAAAALLRARTA